MKDSEIRKFIHDNMPQIEGSGRFMDELVRQIDLLPVLPLPQVGHPVCRPVRGASVMCSARHLPHP